MDLRDAALAVLDVLERHLQKLRDDNKPAHLSGAEAVEVVSKQLLSLRTFANQKGDIIAQGREVSSRIFVKEILTQPDALLLQKLAERDSTVISWRKDAITLGPAAGEFQGSFEDTEEHNPPDGGDFAQQLFRLYNLHCLVTELSGQPNPGSTTGGAQAA